MKIVIAGASGFIGSALVPFLERDGHRVTRLVRREPGPDERRWDPTSGELDPEHLRGADAVVVLSGDNVASGRWTAAKRRRILSSRLDTVGLIAATLADLEDGPRVLVAASAIGFYGSRGAEVIDEEAPPGDGFLAEVCRAWEGATAPAAEAAVRVVNLRIGLVLGPGCELFEKALPLYKLGLGGVMGDPDDYVSWISLEDTVRMIALALTDDRIAGPLNVVSPEPVTNRALTRGIAEALGRPAWLRYPRWVMSLAVGRRAAAELFGRSFRCVPRKAQAFGFTFRHPTLRQALLAELAAVGAG